MAGEPVGINLPTYELNSATVTARNAEYPGGPFTDTGTGTFVDPYLGGNRAASCAGGIGIATGIIEYPVGTDELPEKWTLLDQFGNARSPQLSQHIGGDGLGDGDQSAAAINAWDYANIDFNDTLAFVTADTVAAPDAVFDTVSGAVNRTNETTAVGDVLWGTIPAA